MRPRTGRFLIAGATVAFGLVVALLLPARLHEAITGDAAGYNNAAIHLAAEGFYSQDGKVPFVEREPGQSVWLAGIYSVFGLENHAAAFIAQALLYLLACTLFTRELKRVTSTGTATLCFVLLLSLPSVYHVILSLNRECLALSLLLLCATFFLRWQRSHRFLDAAMSGIFLGAVIVTYAVYLLFPFFLLPLIWHLRLPWRQYGAFVACCALVVSLWGIRNERIRGRPCLTGCTRSAEFWYVRGEQAEIDACLMEHFVSGATVDRLVDLIRFFQQHDPLVQEALRLFQQYKRTCESAERCPSCEFSCDVPSNTAGATAPDLHPPAEGLA